MATIILDCETTGMAGTDKVIELAYIKLQPLEEFRTKVPDSEGYYSERFMPDVPINPRAAEVHGIGFKELLGCRKSEHAALPEGVDLMIGHNITFDHRMLGKPDVKLLCTMDLAKQISKFLGFEFANHKLDTLVEHFSGSTERSKYHSAEGDIKKNIFVLQELLKLLPNIGSWQELYDLLQMLKSKKK